MLQKTFVALFAYRSLRSLHTVRCALAYALGGRIDAISSAALIQLSGDADTRKWATITLGSLTEGGQCLAARLSDADDEVRGEAILGLAKKGGRARRAAIASGIEPTRRGDACDRGARSDAPSSFPTSRRCTQHTQATKQLIRR